jgi:hypothetical protein
MAYAFDKITNLVGGEEEGGSDIFSGEVATNSPQQPDDQTGVVAKTSTAGDIGDTSGGGGTDKVEYNEDTGDQVSASDVMKANVGKTEAPQALEGIKQQISKNDEALQQQANEYTQAYKDQYQFDIENQALDQAIQSGYGSDEYKAADTLLQRQDPGAAQQFEGADDYRVSDVDLLKNDAGLGYLAGQGRGPQYTQGMGAFDVMLMKRDPYFNEMVNEIRGDSAALDKQIATTPDQLEQQAYEYGQGQLQTAQGAAKDYIGDYRERLKTENEAEADAYEQAIRDLDREAIAAEQLGLVGDEVKGYFGGLYRGDRYNQQIEDVLGGYDPTDRIKFNETDYDYQDFLDSGEASQLSNVGGLLGTGEAYTEAQGPGEQYTVDKGGIYDQLVSQINQARNTRDLEQKSALQKIMDAAEGRATAEDERLSGLKGSYEEDLQKMAQQIAAANRYRGVRADDYQGFTDPNFYTKDYGATDMLTAEEVAQLNAISQDLGMDQTYQVGGGGGEEFLDFNALQEYMLGQGQNRLSAGKTQRAADAEAARLAEIEAGYQDYLKMDAHARRREELNPDSYYNQYMAGR